jgi:hypothetical protein
MFRITSLRKSLWRRQQPGQELSKEPCRLGGEGVGAWKRAMKTKRLGAKYK